MMMSETPAHHGSLNVSDPLRTIFEASRAQQRGLMFMANGLQVPSIVVEVLDHLVLAKSQC